MEGDSGLVRVDLVVFGLASGFLLVLVVVTVALLLVTLPVVEDEAGFFTSVHTMFKTNYCKKSLILHS